MHTCQRQLWSHDFDPQIPQWDKETNTLEDEDVFLSIHEGEDAHIQATQNIVTQTTDPIMGAHFAK